MQRAWSRLMAGLAVLGFAVVFTGTAAAQTGKITGVVTDAESGAPLEGAQVLLQGTGSTSLTGSNGRYFMVNVPPGTYTLVVRRIGYTSAEVRNVLVQIDITRTIDVQLKAAGAVGVQEIVISTPETPLVEPGVTGSGTNLRADEITALPVTNIQGVLALQQGFLQIPQNTDIISFTQSRTNPIDPVSIRGGRAGETLTLIDNIPVNNFVFGGPAFDITNEAIEQVDYERGGFEPQYGNALSGIINIATREGGANLAGAVSYQTSAVGAALGNTQDDLRKYNLYQGYVSGPVPGTNRTLRFMIAGRNTAGADRVLQFDNDVYNYTNPRGGANQPHRLDLFPGWRAFGYNNEHDIMGKLTWYVRPTAKLSFTAIDYGLQRLPFDFDWLLTGFNPLNAPAVTNLEDSLAVVGGAIGVPTQNQTIVQGSIEAKRRLYTLKWDHTISSRWAYKITGGRFHQSRLTCNYFQGVCLGNRFGDYNFSGQFVSGGISTSFPSGGTDLFYGGEDLLTYTGRIDVTGQATDHHQIQFGAFYEHHDLNYNEYTNQGVNGVFVVPQVYRAKPWEAALYLQDKIEYDFLTVKLGARFDLGNAGGYFFANPQDPTNGTTAREVCDGSFTYNGVATPKFTYTDSTGAKFSGFAACAANRSLLDSATVIAQQDDFAKSARRTQFSPRIGVSFPLSEQSQVFFNFGRYSQNPLYNNVFQNTGIGTIPGPTSAGGDGVCDSSQVIPVAGVNQCDPIIFSDTYNVSFLGNPNLLIEKTTAYEIGFATELADNYALQVVAFSKDQFGLSGIRQGGVTAQDVPIFDVGATYGTTRYNYQVIVNQDFQTVRGFEVGLRRRLFNYWGFNINYSFSNATTNAAAPLLHAQQQTQGLPTNLQEVTSGIDQPHRFNASIFFRVGNEEPFGNSILNAIVHNASATFTVQAASGLPYTPTIGFAGNFSNEALQQNSGRGPSTFQVNMGLTKDFNVANVRYGVFARVVNLLDTKNCIQVFPTTGQCNAGTINQATRQNGNGVGENSPSTFFDRAGYYGERRSINAGVRLSF